MLEIEIKKIGEMKKCLQNNIFQKIAKLALNSEAETKTEFLKEMASDVSKRLITKNSTQKSFFKEWLNCKK